MQAVKALCSCSGCTLPLIAPPPPPPPWFVHYAEEEDMMQAVKADAADDYLQDTLVELAIR